MSKTVMAFEKELHKIIADLEEWFDENSFAGWDPYDIKGHTFFILLQRKAVQNTFGKFLYFPFLMFIETFPILSRRLFRIKPAINAKAIALLALANIKLYNSRNDVRYLDKYQECIDWLFANNHASNDSQLGWGYPFDWQSQIFIPKHTPLCVPTVLVGHALLDRWEIDGRPSEKAAAKKIITFLLESLNRQNFPEDNSLCFSYCPLDNFLVINANLYTASFLTRAAVLFNDSDVLDIARKARRFSLNEQHEEGWWPYWSVKTQKKMSRHVDNYHTGIILQWLKICEQYDPGNDNAKQALTKGAGYYFNNLFTADGVPKFTDNSIYPIDIHSAAQAFVTFSYLREFVKPALVESVFRYTLDHLYSGKGFFYARKHRYLPSSKIVYFRWSQAWIFYGLSYLFAYINQSK